MLDSALLKLDWATKHIVELTKLLDEKRPFRYVIETDLQTGQRSVFVKRNEPVILDAAFIAADVVHNLRAALDHAYWKIVGHHAKTDAERRKIQFPFSETKAGLDRTIKDGFSDKVSVSFTKALKDLMPHGDPGGNELLYLIHALDLIDKHRTPIPSNDYSSLSGDIFKGQISDFPNVTGNWGAINSRIEWFNYEIDRATIGNVVPPTTNKFEKELTIPISIVFQVVAAGKIRPFIPTLYSLRDVATDAISDIRKSI